MTHGYLPELLEGLLAEVVTKHNVKKIKWRETHLRGHFVLLLKIGIMVKVLLLCSLNSLWYRFASDEEHTWKKKIDKMQVLAQELLCRQNPCCVVIGKL